MATFIYNLWSNICPIVFNFWDIFKKLFYQFGATQNFGEFQLKSGMNDRLPFRNQLFWTIDYGVWGHTDTESPKYTFRILTTDAREPRP